MDPKPELKHDLSMLLNQELAKQLMLGEMVSVSLPGSFGEAFVVTDKRAIVVRECDTGRGCDIHAYPLASVVGAQSSASGTGGFIEIQLAQPPANADEARVYFPAYDLSKFQEAAQFVQKLVSAQAAAAQTAPAAPAAVGGVSDADRTAACPRCGAPNERDSVFCASCGEQMRILCASCGISSPRGAKYCGSCGRSMVEFVPSCPKCGGRIGTWTEFCPECGTALLEKCVVCNTRVAPGNKACWNCGRIFDADTLDVRAGQRFRSRQGFEGVRRTVEQAASQTEPVIAALGGQPPQVTPGPAAPVDASKAAEQHNHRGRELFDNEDVEGAIREFKAAVELDPGNASYHCNLAVALDENEQDGEALAEYENTLRLDPDDLTALLSLGYMYNENEEIDKAKESWSRILEIAPDSAEGQEARTNLDNLGQL